MSFAGEQSTQAGHTAMQPNILKIQFDSFLPKYRVATGHSFFLGFSKTKKRNYEKREKTRKFFICSMSRYRDVYPLGPSNAIVRYSIMRYFIIRCFKF